MAGAALFALSLAHSPRLPKPAQLSALVPIEGKLLVKDGDFIQKGQVIAEFEPASLQVQLQKAELELQQVQGQEQNSIKPMQPVLGMRGTLPARLPEPKIVKIESAKTVTPPATVVPPKPTIAPAIDQGYLQASANRQRAKETLAKATDEVAKATVEVADAQKARDALRPKMIQADLDASQAVKKAAPADELLKAGVISVKRSQELAADVETTKKALEAMMAQVAAADKALSDAQAKQTQAQTALEAASSALKTSDAQLLKAGDAPAPKPIAVEPKKQPVTQAKPMQTAKIVMRRMPMAVHYEELPAIPLQVFVDEKSMQTSQHRIAELQALIAKLKAQIADNKILAPITGRVRLTQNGDIQIFQ